MSFTTAGYQLFPVLPELVLAVGAMVLLMLGAFMGDKSARQKMFDEVKAILLEERKKKKQPVNEQDQEEREHTAHDPFGPTLFLAPIVNDRRDIR